MFADALLTGTVLQCSLQNLPLESSCVIVALTEEYSTSKPLKVSPEKSLILSCDILVTNERYGLINSLIPPCLCISVNIMEAHNVDIHLQTFIASAPDGDT
jgi:hypothetical protein